MGNSEKDRKSFSTRICSKLLIERTENELIGCMMLDPQQLYEVQQIIQPSDFFHAKEREVYKSLLRLQGTIGKEDYVAVERDLHENAPDIIERDYFSKMAQHTGNPARAIEHAEFILSQSRLRSSIELCTKFKMRYESGDTITSEDMALFQEKLQRLTLDANGLYKVHPIGELMKSFSLETLRRAGTDYPMLGIKDIDENVDLFEPGSLAVVASRPRMGKTTLMRQMALGISPKNNVLIFSLEEPKEMIRDKMVCYMAEVAYRSFRDQVLSDEQTTRMVMCSGLFEDMKLRIVDGPLGYQDITALSFREKVLERKPRVIMIDHLQQMHHRPERGENLSATIGRTTNALQRLAKDLDCAVVLFCQLNRGVESRESGRPSLAELRDSGSIEQDAFTILFLWNKDANEDERKFYIAKNKNGPTLEKRVVFRRDIGKFSDGWFGDESAP